MWLDERWDERNKTSVRDLREWMDGWDEWAVRRWEGGVCGGSVVSVGDGRDDVRFRVGETDHRSGTTSLRGAAIRTGESVISFPRWW